MGNYVIADSTIFQYFPPLGVLLICYKGHAVCTRLEQLKTFLLQFVRGKVLFFTGLFYFITETCLIWFTVFLSWCAVGLFFLLEWFCSNLWLYLLTKFYRYTAGFLKNRRSTNNRLATQHFYTALSLIWLKFGWSTQVRVF